MDYDLNILTMNRQAGRDQSSLPGMYITTPPRRPARGRANDRLIVFLAFEQSGSVSREQIKQLQEGIERSYYAAAGTVTSALRAVAEEVNDALLNHNLRDTGRQMVAYLSLVVMRGELLYLAQSGLTHGFLFSASGIEHLYDAQTAGRGLGVSRNTPVRYFQTTLKPGITLMLTPKVPSGWNQATLQGAYGQQISVLRRRFLTDAGLDMQGVLFQAQPGRGKVNLIPASGAVEQPTPPAAKPPAKAAPPSQAWEPLDIPAEEPAPSGPVVTTSTLNPGLDTTAPVPRSASVETAPVGAPTPRPGSPRHDDEAPDRSSRPARQAPDASQLLASGTQKARELLGRALRSLRAFAKRAMPSDEDFKLPAKTMAFIAVAVPLLVVVVAAVVYLRVGLPKQRQALFEQAQAYAQEAQLQPDVHLKRQALENALDILEQIALYDDEEEGSAALRMQVQTDLDTLDGVSRLDFQRAIAGTLNPNLNIIKMVATERDLYMLDGNNGQVLRAWLTGTGYEMDPEFRCGPGEYGTLIIQALIDIEPLERLDREDPAVLAMDANGNLLYCAPEVSPLAVPLVPPDSHWGQPNAMAVEAGNLYILDPMTNAVWIYRGEDGQFREAPYFFFPSEVPQLGGTIDFDISQGDLYLLHAEGRTITCTYSEIEGAATHCTDPATLQDDRPGRESGPILSDARFFQVLHVPQPEHSVFYLDPISRAVYHFSMKLSLVHQYRAAEELPPGIVTAFAVSPTRTIFIAIENQVFIAFLP